MKIVETNRTYIDQSRWGENFFVPTVNKFYLIKKGSIKITVNGESVEAHENDLVLLPLHTTQSLQMKSDVLDHYWCHFLLPHEEEDLFNQIKCLLVLPLSPEDLKRVESLFSPIINCHDNLVSMLKGRSALYDLISFYLDQNGYQSIRHKSKSDTQIRIISDYINNHINETICVSDMAELLLMNPNYFSRFFKKHFHDTPIQYINSRKIKIACDLLLFTDETITSIASNIGYCDEFYFSRVFKKHKGMNPSDFRYKRCENLRKSTRI